MNDLKKSTDRPNVTYGDERIALQNEILRSTVGSELYGLNTDEFSDTDEIGIFIEPMDQVIGLKGGRDDFVSRTQPEGVRSGAGDTDLIIYSLRRYIELAIKGNPTVLLPLFAPEDKLVLNTPLGTELRGLRYSFLSLEAVERFLGYMHAQHERMLGGGKRNRVPNRPELVEKYGYDTKYAAHSLRLALQGLELATKGTLTLPMQETERKWCLEVKTGQWKMEDVSAYVKACEDSINVILQNDFSPLPKKPDYQKISDWMQTAYLRHWSSEKEK